MVKNSETRGLENALQCENYQKCQAGHRACNSEVICYFIVVKHHSTEMLPNKSTM